MLNLPPQTLGASATDFEPYLLNLPTQTLGASATDFDWYSLNLPDILNKGLLINEKTSRFIGVVTNTIGVGQYEIAGYVKNINNNPVSRSVIAVSRENMLLLDRVSSDSITGYFKLKVPNLECVVLCLPLASDGVNAEVFDKIIPQSPNSNPGFIVDPELGNLSNQSVTETVVPWTAGNQTFAQTYVVIYSNGTWALANNLQGILETGDFGTPTGSGIASSFYVKFTRTSYTVTPQTVMENSATETTGWIALTTSPQFAFSSLKHSAPANSAATYTIQISPDATGSVISGQATNIILNCQIATM